MQRICKKFTSGFKPTMCGRNFIAFSLGVSRDTIVLCPQNTTEFYWEQNICFRHKYKRTYKKSCESVSNNPYPLRGLPLYFCETHGEKSIPPAKNMFLCSSVLINYPYICQADAIKLRALRACFARVFTSPRIFLDIST